MEIFQLYVGFVKNQHTVGIFFDLEKAYDTTWKGGIIKDLHEMGLKGRLPLFIDNFLKRRKFKVRLDHENIYSFNCFCDLDASSVEVNHMFDLVQNLSRREPLVIWVKVIL